MKLLAKILALFFMVFAGSSTFAQTHSLVPIRLTCAGYMDGGDPYVLVDFSVKEAAGAGSHVDQFVKTYTYDQYPYSNSYRLIAFPDMRFRVAAQISRHVYSPKQYVVYLSVYEELKDQLVYRSGSILGTDNVKNGYRFSYEIPKTARKVVCHTFAHQAGKATKPSGRIPAKAP